MPLNKENKTKPIIYVFQQNGSPLKIAFLIYYFFYYTSKLSVASSIYIYQMTGLYFLIVY